MSRRTAATIVHKLSTVEETLLKGHDCTNHADRMQGKKLQKVHKRDVVAAALKRRDLPALVLFTAWLDEASGERFLFLARTIRTMNALGQTYQDWDFQV